MMRILISLYGLVTIRKKINFYKDFIIDFFEKYKGKKFFPKKIKNIKQKNNKEYVILFIVKFISVLNRLVNNRGVHTLTE